MGNTFILFYVGTFLFYLSAFLFDCVELTIGSAIAGTAGLLMNGFLLIYLVIISGHLPLFNIFESMMSSSFVLACFALIFAKRINIMHHAVTMVWMEVLLLVSITIFFPKFPAISRFDFNNIYVICFFLFRLLFLVISLFSSALVFGPNLFSLFKISKKNEETEVIEFYRVRNFLLLGSVMFLISEYSGMIWCQNGWGDMWQWSGGHLQSIFIFFYLMLAFHIQEKKMNNHRLQSIVAGMTGFLMLVFAVIRGLG